jgi:hypothetical protein
LIPGKGAGSANSSRMSGMNETSSAPNATRLQRGKGHFSGGLFRRT